MNVILGVVVVAIIYYGLVIMMDLKKGGVKTTKSSKGEQVRGLDIDDLASLDGNQLNSVKHATSVIEDEKKNG